MLNNKLNSVVNAIMELQNGNISDDIQEKIFICIIYSEGYVFKTTGDRIANNEKITFDEISYAYYSDAEHAYDTETGQFPKLLTDKELDTLIEAQRKNIESKFIIEKNPIKI